MAILPTKNLAPALRRLPRIAAVSLLLACPSAPGSTTDTSTGGDASASTSGTATSGDAASTGSTGVASTSNTSADPSSGTTGAADPCADFVGLATPEEIAATPRADAEAELLAIEASGAFVAPQPLYDRVTAELAAIRAANPEVAAISAKSYWQLRAVALKFTPEAFATIDMYDGWNCANTFYQVEKIEIIDGIEWVILHFAGLFDYDALAGQYQTLPGVQHAEAEGYAGEGDDVCLEIDGGDHAYIFRKGGGDCPAGCTENQYWGFVVDEAMNVSLLGFYDDTQGMPPPSWLADLATCVARL